VTQGKKNDRAHAVLLHEFELGLLIQPHPSIWSISWYPVVYDEFKVKSDHDFDFTFRLIPLHPGDCPASIVQRQSDV